MGTLNARWAALGAAVVSSLAVALAVLASPTPAAASNLPYCSPVYSFDNGDEGFYYRQANGTKQFGMYAPGAGLAGSGALAVPPGVTIIHRDTPLDLLPTQNVCLIGRRVDVQDPEPVTIWWMDHETQVGKCEVGCHWIHFPGRPPCKLFDPVGFQFWNFPMSMVQGPQCDIEEAATISFAATGGFIVDAIGVYDVLPHDCDEECKSDKECDDADPCTQDFCQAGTCVNLPQPGCCNSVADCATSDPCVTPDCLTGVCQYTPVPGCCQFDSDCDDDDYCTVDTCIDGACIHTSTPGCSSNGVCCLPDGSCAPVDLTQCGTLGGQFQSGVACGPVTCEKSWACCVDGACFDLTAGECIQQNGTFFSGQRCIDSPGICQSNPQVACCLPTGACVETTPATCTAEGGFVQSGASCATAGVCLNTGACCMADGSCLDLVAAECAGAGGQYQFGQTCASAGVCTACEEGSLCDDGEICTDNDKCIGGVCVGTTPLDCDDDNNCTTDTCLPGVGCSHQPIEDCDPIGSCCLLDGSCIEQVQSKCVKVGGTWDADVSVCDDPANCGAKWACCLGDQGCQMIDVEGCFAQGGTFVPGVTCDDAIDSGECADGCVGEPDSSLEQTVQSKPGYDPEAPVIELLTPTNNVTITVPNNTNATVSVTFSVSGASVAAGGVVVGVWLDGAQVTTLTSVAPVTLSNVMPGRRTVTVRLIDAVSGDALLGPETSARAVVKVSKPCKDNSDCTDGLTCSAEACIGGQCSFGPAPIAGCCDSDVDCPVSTYCVDNQCRGCLTLSDCDDGSPCTEDCCSPTGVCTHETLPGCCIENSDCDDGDACTTDTCDAGLCIHTESPDPNCCDSADDCVGPTPCHAAFCYKKGPVGYCRIGPPKKGCCFSDLQCSDGDPCTLDQCNVNSLAGTGQCSYPADPSKPLCCITNSDCDDGVKGTIESCLNNTCVSIVVPGFCTLPKLTGLVINEIMPSGGGKIPDEFAEWVEIHNPTGGFVDLTGYTLFVGGTEFTFKAEAAPKGEAALLMPPGGYAVIGKSTDKYMVGFVPTFIAPELSLPDPIEDEASFSANLALLGPEGTLTDYLSYDKSWGIQPGRSLERKSPYHPGSEPTSWQASGLNAIDSLNRRYGPAKLFGSPWQENMSSLQPPPSTGCPLPPDAGKCDVPVCGLDNSCTVAKAEGCCETDKDCVTADPCSKSVCDLETLTCSEPVAVEGCCVSNAECDDGNPCNLDRCIGLTCRHSPNIVEGCCAADADCEDGDVCTLDSCGDDNTCAAPVPAPVADGQTCCGDDADCDDADLSTLDLCEVEAAVGYGVCVNVANPEYCDSDASPCDDGDPCTVDACDVASSTCEHAPVTDGSCCSLDVECPDPVEPCTLISGCNYDTNECVYKPEPGCCVTADDCNDADACTTDVCTAAGVCQYVPKDECCLSDKDCKVGGVCTAPKCDLDSLTCFDDPILGCCDPKGSPEQTDDFCGALPDGAGACGMWICPGGVCEVGAKPGCCTTADDCDDASPCTFDVCSDGVCKFIENPDSGCCFGDADCGASEWCGPEGVCAPKLQDGLSCEGDNQCASGQCVGGFCGETDVCDKEYVVIDSVESFEQFQGCSVLSNVTITGEAPAEVVLFAKSVIGEFHVFDAALLKAVYLPELTSIDGWLSVENNPKLDKLNFEALQGISLHLTVALNPTLKGLALPSLGFIGEHVEILGNPKLCIVDAPPFEAITQGDVYVEPGQSCCTSMEDCDDGNPCTSDACLQGQCSHGLIAGCEPEPPALCCEASPEPGCVDKTLALCVCTLLPSCCEDAWTSDCVEAAWEGCGACEPGPTCETSGDCDDADICTTDVCTAAGVCQYVPKDGCCLSDKDCPIGGVCTTPKCELDTQTCFDVPISGCCDPKGSPEETDALCGELPVDAGACGAWTCPDGACEVGTKPNCCTTADECDDASPCTFDTCSGGACKFIPNLDSGCCFGDADCGASEWCGPEGVCAPKLQDGLSCEGDNQCASGQCVGGFCGETDVCDKEYVVIDSVESLELFQGCASLVNVSITAGAPAEVVLFAQYVAGEFHVAYSEFLTGLYLPELNIIEGWLSIESNLNLQEVKVDALQGIGFQLVIAENPALSTLEAPVLESIGDYVAVVGNPKLCLAGGPDFKSMTSGDVNVESGACCASPNDCDDGNPCTADACLEGICTHADIPGCTPEPPSACCTASPEPGCSDSDLEQCVCGLNPSCCEIAWTFECVEAAWEGCGACQDKLGEYAGDCCEANGTKSCADKATAGCVCGLAPECCDVAWTEDCTAIAMSSCAACSPEQACCDDKPETGCPVAPSVEACTCSLMPTCCKNPWSDECAYFAATQCGLACGPSVPSIPNLSACCEPTDTPGCKTGPVESCVCDQEPSCCETMWGAACVEIATGSCGACQAFPECCWAQPGVPGCSSNDTVQACVCAEDPSCCDTAWTFECASIAENQCGLGCAGYWTSGTPPIFGTSGGE